jgi:hypothetical protein
MDFNHNGKDDLDEIKDGFDKFISDVQAGNINAVVTDVVDAGAWLKGELEGLEQDAQSFFNWGVDRVKAESKDVGEAVANMLTLLANGNLQGALGVGATATSQLAALSSEVVTAAVGLIGGFKSATK